MANIPNSLKIHRKIHAKSKISPKKPKKSKFGKGKNQKLPNQIYSCKKCNKKYKFQGYFRKHKCPKKAKKVQKITCESCQRNFKTKKNLKKHKCRPVIEDLNQNDDSMESLDPMIQGQG